MKPLTQPYPGSNVVHGGQLLKVTPTNRQERGFLVLDFSARMQYDFHYPKTDVPGKLEAARSAK